ncbi:MAG: DUF2489 domain-containing protein [Alteromonadaceae bacterium]|nr:DUF2489 domain-containing protein [Alteromonadaceae bacterium]
MVEFISANITLVLISGIIIIFGLAGYGLKLTLDVKKQEQALKHAKNEKLSYLFESIETIASATLQQQCSVSEATVRLFNLIAMVEQSSDVIRNSMFDSLSNLYVAIKDHPYGKARKNASKLLLAKLDAEREQLESEFETAILKELELVKEISSRQFAALNSVQDR